MAKFHPDVLNAVRSMFAFKVNTQILEAFINKHREDETTFASIAQTLGWDRDEVESILLSVQNGTDLTLRTIAELCYALDATPDFTLTPLSSPEIDITEEMEEEEDDSNQDEEDEMDEDEEDEDEED